jgi:hypothetical protein
MNPLKLIVALLFGAVLASSSYDSSPISKEDVFQVTQIIKKDEDQPEQLVELFKDRRLSYSKDAESLLSKMISRHQPRLFKRFFKFIDFEPGCRDKILSELLESAIFEDNPKICAFVLSQDFQYIGKEKDPWRFFDEPDGNIESWDLVVFKELISDSDMAEAICPQPRKHLTMEQMLFLIELAHHCASVSDNPGLFNPTAWLHIIMQRPRLSGRKDDPLIKHLCELGAELEQNFVDTVKQNGLVLPQTYQYLQSQGIIPPASPPFPVDYFGASRIQRDERFLLEKIMRHEELPEVFIDLLEGCSFAYSGDMGSLLHSMITFNRPASFAFFCERTNFGHVRRDEYMTDLLKTAFCGDCIPIIHFLLDQNFANQTGCVIFKRDGWNSERAIQLLEAHPRRLAEMLPHSYNMYNCRNPEYALLLIDLASHFNPARFRPSEFLDCFVHNDRLEDNDMVSVIRHLCHSGARVEPSMYEGLDHHCYPQSRQALQEHETNQDTDIKEPEMDLILE